MDEAEFDKFADEYDSVHSASIKLSGESSDFFARNKVKSVFDRVNRLGLKIDALLDFGCGIGNSIPHCKNMFPGALIHGVDISSRCLSVASQRFSDIAKFEKIAPGSLALINQTYDIIFSACVFHHIPPERHVSWLRELREVGRPGALLAVFEHNPWNPLTRYVVRTSPLDQDAQLVSAVALARAASAAGWREITWEYQMFFPHVLAALRPLERLFRRVPLGAQYVMYARA